MGISMLLAGIVFFFIGYGRIATPLLALLSVAVCLGYVVFHRRHRHTHGAFVSIDFHAQRSRMNRVHTGLKLIFCLGCAVLCVAADSVPVSLALAAAMLLLTVAGGKIPAGYYFTLLALPLVFILLGAIAILFEVSPFPLGYLDLAVGSRYISVTAAGQIRAIEIICKAFGAVSCLYFLSLTTPMHRIIGVLRRARIPAVVVELMYLIYRYIFILLEAQAEMKIAATARLGYRGARTSLKTTLNSSFFLLFHSLRRASDCFAAMESRCYDGEIRFLEEAPVLRGGHIAIAGCFGAVLCAVWLAAERGVL